MQVQWTNKAKKRLEEIEAYIGQESPAAAIKVIITIIKKTATQLSKYPDSGKSGRKMGTRELLFSDTPYLCRLHGSQQYRDNSYDLPYGSEL